MEEKQGMVDTALTHLSTTLSTSDDGGFVSSCSASTAQSTDSEATAISPVSLFLLRGTFDWLEGAEADATRWRRCRDDEDEVEEDVVASMINCATKATFPNGYYLEL